MKHSAIILLLVASAGGAAAQGSTEAAPVAANSEVELAYMRRMQSDLRNLFTAQEMHYSRHNGYAGPADDVNAVDALAFHTSREVAVRIVEASARGWSAVASTQALPGRGCVIFVGGVGSPRTAGGMESSEPGSVFCDGIATIATIRSDLRNLMSAQEVHYSSAMTYTSAMQGLGFEPSLGVTVRITAASDRGSAAVATNGTNGCAYFVGNAEPPATPRGFRPTEEGRILCD